MIFRCHPFIFNFFFKKKIAIATSYALQIAFVRRSYRCLTRFFVALAASTLTYARKTSMTIGDDDDDDDGDDADALADGARTSRTIVDNSELTRTGGGTADVSDIEMTLRCFFL